MTGPRSRAPIFHLSVPVRDLEEALRFYTGALGGRLGRREQGWVDVALFGVQLTLRRAPEDVLQPMPRSRHFGATMDWGTWEELTAALSEFVEPPRVDFSGTDREQAKAMVADPSGNLVELKAYRHPDAVLGQLAAR
jgi:hypothetical protein